MPEWSWDTESFAAQERLPSLSPWHQRQLQLGRARPLHSRIDAIDAVQWYDIPTTGRYTKTRTTHITIRPTAVTDLATIFTTWIDRARIRQQDTDEQFAHGTW
ncbi:hypothetical protein [Nocardia vinacea]|uniref:hypothetical protein n=1 Tax=Nocardia vinacea TaxID=96468 RepID=UPI0002D7D7D5|nr:hypothetical protein [Nocardia vinacea]